MESESKGVESFLTEKHLKTIIHHARLNDWKVLGFDVKPATLGITGFLGDHFKVVVHLQNGEITKQLYLFAKTLPLRNKPKADFINDFNFFRRENLVYTLFEEMHVPGDTDLWCTKAFVHSDKILIMPDLSTIGYKSVPISECFDLNHVKVTVKSLAQFHAKFACFEARRNSEKSFYEEHKSILQDSAFFDCPWLRAAAKLSANILLEFSTRKDISEDVILGLFLKACDDLTVSDDSINVILHRDLWTNNIMFRYDDDQPQEAVLLDYQCLRYGPPAFDLMIFLYMTTSKQFREAHEKEVCNYYYTVFTQNLDDTMKGKLKDYNYGRWHFLNLCERARMFAMMEAMSIYPFILMDPVVAQRVFDDPKTFMKVVEEDRSTPVLALARQCDYYRNRQVEVSEEFIDRYYLKRL